MDIKNQMKARYELLDKLSRKTSEKLREYPEGSIKIKKCKSGVYYYRSDMPERDKIIPKNDINLVKQLAQKNYLEAVLKTSSSEAAFLNQVIENYPDLTSEAVYSRLSDERKQLVRPILLPDDQYIAEWQSKPYITKPFRNDAPVYITMRGERVRSKSEMIIADRLYANNIPYRYECPLILNGILIHPDFTILRIPDRKELYLEHCGRIGDEDYSDDFVDRINLYSDNGIVVGDRLFLTFETVNKPLDVRTIDRLISGVFTQESSL